jgi:Flp pilus assembly pilin Flp
MLKYRERLTRARRDERGISGVEYAIIVALVGVAIVGVITILGRVLGGGYSAASDGASAAASGQASSNGTGASAPAGAGGAESSGGDASDGQGGSSGGSSGGDSPQVEDGSSDGGTGPGGEQETGPGAGPVEQAPGEGAENGGGGSTPGCTDGYVVDATSGSCVPSAKDTCIGDQTYDEVSNNCLVPKCDGQSYDAATGTCVESAASKCAANKQGYSSESNSCYPCAVGWDATGSSCVPQKDCSADNKIPNGWNVCLSVDEYVGTLQGASLNSIKNGWLPQPPKTTKTYNVFSAADTSSWKDEPWILSTAPYSAKIVSVSVRSTSNNLKDDKIPVPNYTADTITLTTPNGPKYAQYELTYTVQVTYPWNGTTRTATKTLTTTVGLQS